MATLSDIKTRVRERADMVNSQFISDSEMLSYVNSAYQELYELLVNTNEDYYTTSTTFTLSSSDNGVYALPSDFFKLRGVEYLLSGEYITIYPYNWNERNSYNKSVTQALRPTGGRAYRMMGSNLRIRPSDSAVGSYQMWYVPTLTALSADTDVVDTIMTRAGWEEYVVIEAAIKCLAKEESSTTHLMQEKMILKQRIIESASERDIDQPEKISDIRGNHGDFWI